MKRIVSVLLALIFVLGAVSCAEGTVNVAALNGPTGMGMVKMMKDEEGKEAYAFTLAGAPDMITPKLIKGELDINDDAVWAAYVEGLKSQYAGFDALIEVINENVDLDSLSMYND